MRHALLGFAAVFATVGAQPTLASDPAAWLVQASDAARQANYQGVVVYRDARAMEVLRIAHRQRGGRVEERLTSLTGQPRDLLRTGDGVSCASADQPVFGVSGVPQSLFPVLSQETIARAQAHYEFRDTGESRVAGRTCRSVAMAPRDEFRYGYEICADTATAVPLKVSLLDRSGRPIEQLVFTEVAFPAAIDDAAFAAPAALREHAPAPTERVTTASGAPERWRLERLPPGFQVVLRSRRAGAEGEGTVEHVLLSDGLSAVSVFGAPASPADLRGLSQTGAINAYGRSVGAFHVTVVGEVPESTVRMIGDGFATDERRTP